MRADSRPRGFIVSGDLDEHRIAQLLADAAPIDAFGVGTALSTSSDAPALGGVYKLVEIERDDAHGARPEAQCGQAHDAGEQAGVAAVCRTGVRQVTCWRSPASHHPEGVRCCPR